MSNLLHYILPPPRKEFYLYTNYIGLSINHRNKIMVSSSHELKTTADSN